MLSAPIPENENQRLEALRSYGILDSDAYACMQPLTKLAADICDCPKSTISLIDKSRVWFYTKVGLGEEAKEVPRDISVCAHILLHQQTMIIPDTLKDDRFSDNPFVLEELSIRFYAGVPLINKDGFVLGTLCVFDHVPGNLSPKQISLLERLRDVVVNRLESSLETQQRYVEDKDKNAIYGSLLNTDILGIVLFNNEGEIIDYNTCFKTMWNIDDELLINNDPTSLKEHFRNQVAIPEEYVNPFEKLSGDITAERINILHMKDGTVIEQHDYPFIKDDKPIARVCLFRDMTDHHILTEKLSYQATHDLLTGLVNRFEFERRLERILSEAGTEKSEHVLCYMDLDNFKQVNDTFGHISGDYLLQEISQLLGRHIRKRDTLARVGGDEFGLLMEHCSINQAKRVAKNLINVLIETEIDIDGKKVNIGISIGMIPIDASCTDKIEVLKKVDAACYTAKRAGRNRFHVASIKLSIP